MAGRCERLEHERTFGDDCIVRSVTAMDVQRRYIRRHEMQKIMRKTFAGRLTDARTKRRS